MRLSDVPPEIAEGWRNTPLPQFESLAWTPAPLLSQARLAIVTTAGLHRRSDANFVGGAADYRLIPGDTDINDLVQSHVSVNFDRTVFQQDTNAVFPLEHLRGLVKQGEIGSLGNWHYSFMGATDPTRMVDAGKQVAGLLRDDGVQAVVLVPV
jgi:D-proline reductase (dithiol) PrdB